MSHPRIWLFAIPALLFTGCYHATVETGRPPSGVVVERPWAHSFIGGLVPPTAVETASRCPNGIARVDTQLSFLNLLVGGLTSGIYTPMSVRVQCAADAGDAALLEASGDALATLQEAADLSRETSEAVFVRFGSRIGRRGERDPGGSPSGSRFAVRAPRYVAGVIIHPDAELLTCWT